MSPDREQAELLLRKASEDLRVLVALFDDDDIADAILGFHAQQAVEKALKAVLAAHSDGFPWTHDVQLLIERVAATGADVPEAVREARRLTPWAVEFRYGESIDEALDRSSSLHLVTDVLRWADQVVRSASSD